MKRTMIICCISICLVLSQCVYRKADPAVRPLQSGCETPETVSFSLHVLPILTTKCGVQNCHAGARPEANLNLEAANAYQQLTLPNRDYLNVAQPERSLLHNSLTSAANQMPPPPANPLPECDITLIKQWMKQGALNN